MTKEQYTRILEFLRDKRAIESTFKDFTETDLREAVEVKNKAGIAVKWVNIVNYLIVVGNPYSSEFFTEATMNALKEILEMPTQEGRAWAEYLKSLIDRLNIQKN